MGVKKKKRFVYLRELQKTERERERKGGNDKRSDRSKRPMQELHSSSSFLSFSRVFFPLPSVSTYLCLSFPCLSSFKTFHHQPYSGGLVKRKTTPLKLLLHLFFTWNKTDITMMQLGSASKFVRRSYLPRASNDLSQLKMRGNEPMHCATSASNGAAIFQRSHRGHISLFCF